MMKKYFLMLLIPISFAYCQQKDITTESELIFAQLQKREFAKVTARFDSTLAARIDTARLRQTWDRLLPITGPFVKVINITTDENDTSRTVTQHMQFEKRKIDFKIVYGLNDRIKVLTFLPGEVRDKYKLPDYNNPDLYVERKLTLDNGPYKLPGLLTTPRKTGKSPLIIFIHGSGPNDKDETVGPMKIFKDFTIGFTQKGIATYRYEKRTRVYSIRMQLFKNLTIKDETIEDAIAAINQLKKDSTVDSTNIFLCGHSMGAYILPRIAEAVPNVKGLIYLCPNIRPLEDVIYDQSAYLLENDTTGLDKKKVLDSLQTEVARIKNLKEPNTDSVNIFRFPPAYWLDLKKYDPIKTARSLKMPMLFVHGQRDYQTTMEDYNAWKTALEGPQAKFILYPDLNHFFIKGQGKSTYYEYSKSANVDIGVINDIASWVLSKSK